MKHAYLYPSIFNLDHFKWSVYISSTYNNYWMWAKSGRNYYDFLLMYKLLWFYNIFYIFIDMPSIIWFEKFTIIGIHYILKSLKIFKKFKKIVNILELKILLMNWICLNKIRCFSPPPLNQIVYVITVSCITLNMHHIKNKYTFHIITKSI